MQIPGHTHKPSSAGAVSQRSAEGIGSCSEGPGSAARVLQTAGVLYLVEANLPKPLTAAINSVGSHRGHVERIFSASQLLAELAEAGWESTQLRAGLIQVVKASVSSDSAPDPRPLRPGGE